MGHNQRSSFKKVILSGKLNVKMAPRAAGYHKLDR